MQAKKRGRPAKTSLPELPGHADTHRLHAGAQTALLQARVPKILYEAARAQLDADGLSLRQLCRWALVEYLAQRETKLAQDTWNACV